MKMFSVLSLSILATACNDLGTGSSTTTTTRGVATSQTDVAVEEALADLDTGKSPPAARAKLDAALAQGEMPKEKRGAALLALANATLPTDREKGITLLEEAIAQGEEKAESKLFSVLTGHELPSGSRWNRGGPPPAAFAEALVKYFPENPQDHAVHVDLLGFGGTRSLENLGTFNVAAAIRQKDAQVCASCPETKTNVRASMRFKTSWTGIPESVAQMETSLVVLYLDKETMLPERYARWAAAPLADIQAAIDKGEGFVAVKERPNAPPLVTIAAPRATQWRQTEAALASTSSIPDKPLYVKFDGLDKEEIQFGVRGRFPEFKKCYEKVLSVKKDAAGDVEFAFAVTGKGTVTDLVVTGTGALDEAGMKACMAKGLEGAKFPEWSSDPAARTTVKYPVKFAP
ncbi:MAG: AgmX/PglI C-terminal domain-containing protein [Polyangiaceae bacterium]